MVPGTVQRAHIGHKDEALVIRRYLGAVTRSRHPKSSLGAPLPNYQTPLHKCSILIETEVDKLTRHKLSGMHALVAVPQYPSHRRELLKLHSVNLLSFPQTHLPS